MSISAQKALQKAISQANAQQALASDPSASVFVSASAGSGKTKLLIDRLLRLMLPRLAEDGSILPGSSPARILCLTFTKAAAAEMSIRLQKRLGRWVTLSDEELDKELAGLYVPCTEETRRRARALFAEVLDLPGGMRIGTIHAFCQSLLRRFPLEASMNPHFTVMEETDASLALQACVEAILGQQKEGVISSLAGQISLGDFIFISGVLRKDERSSSLLKLVVEDFDKAEAVLCQILGLSPDILHGSTSEFLEKSCTNFPEEQNLREGFQILSEEGSEAIKRNAFSLLDWLALPASERAAQWSVWRNGFLTKEGKLRSVGLISKKLSEKYSDISLYIQKESERISKVEEHLRARKLAEMGSALLKMAAAVSSLYTTQKARHGQIEYDDLIQRALGLLREPGAAWVMYKLDGGIDHLLLDEVQDTSPEQWRIAGDLTEEFFAGLGGRSEDEPPRTIFAVGDYKQSIYGFQGADPDSFREWRQKFKKRVQDAHLLWREPELTVSFRSTAPVLKLVDAVFADPEAAKGVVEEPGQIMEHITARPGEGGRVELWPLVEAEKEEDIISPWEPAQGNATRQSPRQKLADAVAGYIFRQLNQKPLSGQKPLTPGDVLVLVPRRSPFVGMLVRALKGHNIPVVTLVRTGLAEHLAVQDMLSLCAALLLPQDDLTLACVLTSPLGGVSDNSLMALAAGREKGEPLWSALRERHAEQSDWKQAWNFLNGLFRQVDYLTPYEFLSAALGPGGARARFLARLGPEAAEPIDELLSAAIRYQDQHPPSLQGFLHWMRHSEETVKREAEAGGDSVRIMTAHGSKGLQARLVILPDTVGLPRFEERLFWAHDKKQNIDVPLYVPRNALSVGLTRSLKDVMRSRVVEEYNRLLYVALTRAADRLVVCGWKPGRNVPAESWYERCRIGFEKAGATEIDFQEGGWSGSMLLLEETPQEEVNPKKSVPTSVEKSEDTALLPQWMGTAPLWKPTLPEAESPLARPLAPSKPDDAMLGPLPPVRSPLDIAAVTPAKAREAAFRRGNLVHSLLQFLPACSAEQQPAMAHQWLARPASGLSSHEAAELAQQVIAVLRLPELADLFDPSARAEQRLAGVAGGQVIVGQVDRLRVLPNKVLVCDFKTGRHAPRGVEDTPVLYLRQMAAYRALLQGIWPDRPVVCVLVWTEMPRADVLPDALLDKYAPGILPAAVS
ncbi:double-strand break repair helicase AddA [Acetobacter pasteurianus]|uniref:DNA 3'-5' helicase n=2 Tax=Acetobacter pasteurianus TaxID=438 RepID=C7JGX2_ACEP3|nr:double-strand break repair helicase AddA [Acetobacter pasteurianus]ASC05718.1 ATP-dependent helicase/nuclease subunit [Acetobacter pasteurianus subsp. pasteurianus]BAI00707.1 DNA helicase II UvrD/Rep [Acetobacter pasteurianus IFO 3283-01]BAI03756.1 DNA helicase II UvrD/Rep [Acetobacter pasteurianus IFO 3283-03]BAI06803.1 DNA helicase II UvrD/Rep [Acetobacter pasteurianus IFO 3283-07]BAI09851.1 DNA helicase II UvrD/Rep [Acetobacter pasteurianus IFO 3283-22]